MNFFPRKPGFRVWARQLVMGLLVSQCVLVVADASAQSAQRGAYEMPYTRYEADQGSVTGSTALKQAPQFDQVKTAAEASQQKYVELTSQGSSVQWQVNEPGSGVTLRFTLPDSGDGTGLNGAVDVYVNGQLDQTVDISSYYAWQYFVNYEPENTPAGDKPRMRFDEVHFRLNTPLQAGDTLRISKATSDGIAYGVDFVEIEPVPAMISKPAGFVSITDYGAVANDGNSDLDAMYAAISAAETAGTGVYLPPGQYQFDDKLVFEADNISVRGAGMWYTSLYFSNPAIFSGGILARASHVNFSDFYMNTINNRRFFAPGQYMIYKAFMGTYGDDSRIDHVWAEHFEAGAWLGGYDAPYPVDVTHHLTISHVRFRNNYADGVNFSQGTSDSIVEQSNIRNGGDDALAVWPSNSPAVPEGSGNVFRYNTVEHNFRAAGLAIFGGRNHEAHNLLIRDCFAGSGMRFTTDFPGYTFSQQGLMRFYDIDIKNCGTSYDLWDRKRGAIEFLYRRACAICSSTISTSKTLSATVYS